MIPIFSFAADNTTSAINDTLNLLVSLLTTIVPILIIIAIFSFVLHALGKGAFSKLDFSDADETESNPKVAKVYGRVVCTYCGGSFVMDESTTQCPDCYAPYPKFLERADA